MHERKRNRLQGFDYASEQVYFLTSCVQDRICCLGDVKDNEMILNQYGKIVAQQIEWLPKQYEYFLIHNYVVMPNHVHILGEIRNCRGGSRPAPTITDITDKTNQHLPMVQAGRDLPEQKIKSISELMGAFKTTSSKQIHLTGYVDFKWQRSFHDHIVRNDISFDKIDQYISQNPFKWTEDKLNDRGE